MTTDPLKITLVAGNTAFITALANSTVSQKALFSVLDDQSNPHTGVLEGVGSHAKMQTFDGSVDYLNFGPFTKDQVIKVTLSHEASGEFQTSNMLTASPSVVSFKPGTSFTGVNISTTTLYAQCQVDPAKDDCIATIMQTAVAASSAAAKENPSAVPATSAEATSSASA